MLCLASGSPGGRSRWQMGPHPDQESGWSHLREDSQ